MTGCAHDLRRTGWKAAQGVTARADVTKAIRGYGADTREYAANTRIDIHAPNSVCRVYASSRGNIKGYQSSHKYSQIRGLDIRRYADIRGHSHRFTVTYPRMVLVTSLPSCPRKHCYQHWPDRQHWPRPGSPPARGRIPYLFPFGRGILILCCHAGRTDPAGREPPDS